MIKASNNAIGNDNNLIPSSTNQTRLIIALRIIPNGKNKMIVLGMIMNRSNNTAGINCSNKLSPAVNKNGPNALNNANGMNNKLKFTNERKFPSNNNGIPNNPPRTRPNPNPRAKNNSKWLNCLNKSNNVLKNINGTNTNALNQNNNLLIKFNAGNNNQIGFVRSVKPLTSKSKPIVAILFKMLKSVNNTWPINVNNNGMPKPKRIGKPINKLKIDSGMKFNNPNRCNSNGIKTIAKASKIKFDKKYVNRFAKILQKI